VRRGIIAANRRRGGSGRGFATAESLAEQTTSGASQDAATITTTLSANTDYLFFWSQDVATDSTASAAASDVLVGGTSIFTSGNIPSISPRQTTSPQDYHSMGGFFRVQAGASPTLVTHKTQGKRGATAANLKVKNARLSYIKLGPTDVYSQSLSRTTVADPTDKTAQTAGTLSFTPPSTGDYLIMAFAVVDIVSQTNVSFYLELTDGTTTTGEHSCRPPASTDRIPIMLALNLSSVSGAKTLTLKCRQGGTGTTTIGFSEVRMVAIRKDRFANTYCANQAANSSGTETAYTTTHSQTFTPAAGSHLTVAFFTFGCASTTASGFCEYDDSGTVVNEFVREFGTALDFQGVFGISHRLAIYAASSRTQSIKRKAESAATVSTQGAACGIATFDLSGI
jgi:hypothetical protein